MMQCRRKRRRVAGGATSGGSDSEDDESDGVERDGATIFFHCDVSTKTVLQLIRAIRAAESHAFAHGLPNLTILVHSYGGCAFAGLSAYDHIHSARVPVYTVATGFVASAATILCLAGARRFAHRHACLLIHELSTGIEGKLGELMEEVSNSKVTMDLMQSVYEERTNRTRRDLKAMLKKETMLNFKKAVEYGFVEGAPPMQSDRVETPPQHPPPSSCGVARPNTHIRWP